MAKRTKDTQKEWFGTGAYPTEGQFRDVIDSTLGVLDSVSDLPTAGADNLGNEYKVGNTFYKCEQANGGYEWVPKATAVPSNDYDDLDNKPTINGVRLSGDIDDVDDLGGMSLNTGKYDTAAGTDITASSLIYIKGATKWVKTTLGDLISSLNIVNTTTFEAFKTTVLNAAATQTTNSLDNKLDKDLSNIEAVTHMGDGAYIPIMTPNGMVKVSTEDLVAYIGIKSRVENSSIEMTIKSQRDTIQVTTVADGIITRFSVQDYYTLGTSAVYLNGNRLYAGRDYVEVNSRTFEFIGRIPTAYDNILFEAIPLATTNPNQESQYAANDEQ